jgi:hypothetical protein
VESSFKAVSADTPLLLRWLQTLRCKASGALVATSDAVTFLGSSETLRELTARLAGEGKPCDMSFDSFLPPPAASTKVQILTCVKRTKVQILSPEGLHDRGCLLLR